MNIIRKNIPNTLTCMSTLFGCIACAMAVERMFFAAMICIVIASVFDFSDGFAARMLGATSSIGKELDSISDEVSFGVAPGFVMFEWLKMSHLSDARLFGDFLPYLPYVAFLIPIFSALRLAKFNVDTRQSCSFIGFPTPANAILISSLVALAELHAESGEYTAFDELMHMGVVLVVLIVALSLLLVSELPMFSLKFKHVGLKGNEDKFALIAIAVVGLICLQFAAIPMIIAAYIMICIGQWAFAKGKH